MAIPRHLTMSTPRQAEPVRLFCGILAAGEALLTVARSELEEQFGPIDAASDVIPFTFTDYYEREMGPGLLRQFVTFERLVDPGRLAAIKLQTNAIETRHVYRRPDGGAGRALNLDPGLLTPASLVLATGKNFAHRIYLSDGIYAELTLLFRKGRAVVFEWTYPDFRGAFCLSFVLAARQRLLSRVRTAPGETAGRKP